MSTAAVDGAAATTGAGVASSSASAAAANGASASAAVAVAASPSIHSFSFEWMDSQLLHAQVWFLASSLLVWVGDQSASMASLTLAIKSSMDSSPSVSCLLGGGLALGSGSSPSATSAGGQGGEEDQNGIGMAARIASVFGLPVFVSLNLSSGGDSLVPGGGLGPELQQFVERTLIKELRACQKLGMFK